MRSDIGKAEGKTTTLQDELLQLGETADRHGTKVLRDNLELINYLVGRGVSLSTIYERLKKNGFRLTYKSFIQTLKVVRKDNKDSRTRPHEVESPNPNDELVDGGHDPPPSNHAAGTKEAKAKLEEPAATKSTREVQTITGETFGATNRHAKKADRYVPQEDSNPLLDQLT